MRDIRFLRFFICGLMLLVLASCGGMPTSSGETIPLALDLAVEPGIIRSIDDLHIEVVLTNRSDEGNLVHRGLFCLPFPGPSWLTAMYLMVSDSSGNLVFNETYTPKHGLPSENTLVVLMPGEFTKRNILLHNLGFYTDMFKKGRRYIIVAVYQNEIDVTKNFIEGPVSSWVGSIRSNEETFYLLP